MIHARGDYNRIQDPDDLIPANEPVFLLRAQDVLFIPTLAFYAFLADSIGRPEIADSVRRHIDLAANWPKRKIPDLSSQEPI